MLTGKIYSIYSWQNKQYRIFVPQRRNSMELIISYPKEQILGSHPMHWDRGLTVFAPVGTNSMAEILSHHN
jgi:hypothetical protein